MISSLAAALMLIGVIGLLPLVLAARARERALTNHVNLIAPMASRNAPGGLVPASVWRTHALESLRALFAFRMRRSWGVSANPVYLLVAGVVTGAAIWLLCGIARGLPGYVAPIGAAVGFFLVPRIVLVREQHRSDAHFAELLPDAVDMVVRMVRAGLPIDAAIRTVGQEANPPISKVFVTIADQTEIGMPLQEALATTSGKIGNPDFRFFAVAVALQQTTGGNLAETLETLSQIIRKRRAVRLKAKAATAEVRISGIVLGAVPFVVTGALLLVAPNYLDPLFSDSRGHIILGAALLCLLLAGLTMRTMIRNSLRG